METLISVFGQGKELNPLQMAARTIVVFMVCLLFIRVSGRRTFGMRMPLDNVITILLGAVMSRAIAGASPFIATVTSGAVIVVLYRIIAWLTIYSKRIGRLVKGEAMPIYKNGRLIRENMERCMITEKDIYEELRRNGNVNSLEHVVEIYIERNGEMGIVKKPGST